MVHALGEEESVCQRQELGWYRGIFVPDTFKGNVSGIFYLIRDFLSSKKALRAESRCTVQKTVF